MACLKSSKLRRLIVNSFSDAADNARLLCDQFYYASPDVTIREHNGILLNLIPLNHSI